ncbi:ribonuclease T2 [Consotaella aegiceratis]|uniref:ribonuclease T2 n=1 Tax=Consotaella aegiceratis TaxID=3097961 RepID=UPI002F423A24
MIRRIVLTFVLFLGLASSALAQVPMVGSFLAEARCPALRSIRSETNPGDVAVEPGERYDLVGRNADPASHYYIVVPGAEPERRWVAIGCGRVEEQSRSAGRTATVIAASDARPAPAASGVQPSRRNVLAVTWEPAFCETKPTAPECARGGTGNGFSLHGLWPQSGDYCGKAESLRDVPWSRLPEPRLSAETRSRLERVMPGVRSALHRHEWARHGSCYGSDAEEYFDDAIRLVDQLNRSDLVSLFLTRAGETLTLRDVRAAFDREYGRGTGARVGLDCALDGKRRVITEMTIGLSGLIAPASDLTDLILAAPAVRSDCQSGIVDPPGFQ